MTAPPQPSSTDGLLLGRTFGRYEFLTLIDRGGMASVFVARSVGVAGFERLVAIKVLHPHMAHEEEFVAMFLDEARLAARIRHPNVVATLDVSDSEGDGYFMVMEYVEGDHLGALLKQASRSRERIPPPVASRILLDALAGLGAAHRLTDEHGQPMSLVHRDVSPQNVLVGTDGIARLTDFGIAKAEVRLTSTREGQFKGKVTYMAPEQATDGAATQQSDLFSTGIVLWESLTGRRLFLGENHAATLYKILEDDIPPPSSMDPALAPFDAVVARALARAPADRYPTASAFAEELEGAALAAGGVATPRAVAELVTRYVGPKIDGEAQRVREAIEQLGRARLEVAPRPQPRSSAPDAAPPPELSAPSASPDVTVADGALVVGPPSGRNRRRLAAAGLGALALAAVGIVGAVALRGTGGARDDGATARGAAAASTGAAPAASAAPVAGEPAPSAAPAPAPDGGLTGDAALAPRADAAPAPAATGAPAPEPHGPAAPTPPLRRSAPRSGPEPDRPERPSKDTDLVTNPYRR